MTDPSRVLQTDRAAARRRLRHMQALALALLLAMAALFVLAHSQRAAHPAWPWVAAFAEAAMVGALADWFAVTALFRHPLGLPIWHTAIVARRKDDIARNLGRFIESHFVTNEAVLARVRSFDPAGRAAAWLQQAPQVAALAPWVSDALRQVLARYDDTRLRDALTRRLTDALAAIDPLPFAARWAEELLAEQRHQQALDWALRHGIDWLETEQATPTIAQVLDTVDHVLISTFSGRIASIVRNGSLRLARAALAEPDHVLRQRFDALVAQGMARLYGDPDWAERVRGFQRDLLASDRVKGSLDALWADLRAALLDDLAQPEPRIGLNVSRLLGEAGHTLAAHEEARTWINDTLCRAVEPVVAANRGRVAAYIQAQVDRWSKDEMTDRIELAIGRDLQFIRINGTVVGGLVGLGLQGLVRWMG
jgi:uncharacterized membrane-anchored protein YjiN (DUF445 family)